MRRADARVLSSLDLIRTIRAAVFTTHDRLVFSSRDTLRAGKTAGSGTAFPEMEFHDEIARMEAPLQRTPVRFILVFALFALAQFAILLTPLSRPFFGVFTTRLAT